MEKYFKLFLKRELLSVFGKKWKNLWIISAVFFVTIGSLGLSRAGLDFLCKKMEDPFIQWIEIKEQGAKFNDFKKYTEETKTRNNTFRISSIEANNYVIEYVLDKDNKNIRVEGRTISADSKLLDRILDKTNATKCVRNKHIEKKDYGWIVTKGMMERLGYTEANGYPLFINLAYPSVPENLTKYGLQGYGTNLNFASVPIPIIAVVDRLPNLLDFMTTNYFYRQLECGSNPFNISIHELYYTDLYIATVCDNNEFNDYLVDCLNSSGLQYDEGFDVEEFDLSFEPLTKYRIIIRNDSTQATSSFYGKLNKLADSICKSSDYKCYRIYEYDLESSIADSSYSPDYLSYLFDDLSYVRNFADSAFQKYGIKVEMSQVEAKGNFKSFNDMANALCYAIIVISIGFIVIFLLFLIDNHFQKISPNLGTIMAFGLDNTQIKKIYLCVFIFLILIGLAIASVALCIIQGTLSVMGIVHNLNGLPYLKMNDLWVALYMLGILIVTFVVIMPTLHQKLKATPGELIHNNK